METMRTIVLVTCVISLLSGVLDALKPNAKFDRQMRLLLSAVFLLGILTPLAKGAVHFQPDWNDDVTVPEELTAAMAVQAETQAGENLATSLEELLQNEGITDAEVEVDMNMTEDSRIEIEHVTAFCADTETARQLLTECLGEEVKIDVEKAS